MRYQRRIQSSPTCNATPQNTPVSLEGFHVQKNRALVRLGTSRQQDGHGTRFRTYVRFWKTTNSLRVDCQLSDGLSSPIPPYSHEPSNAASHFPVPSAKRHRRVNSTSQGDTSDSNRRVSLHGRSFTNPCKESKTRAQPPQLHRRFTRLHPNLPALARRTLHPHRTDIRSEKGFDDQ
jgi:hypothetical protein